MVATEGTREARPLPLRFARSPESYVMIPADARRRRPEMEARLARLAEYAETFPHNRIDPRRRPVGIVTSGVAYQYAREVFPEATFLKLALQLPAARSGWCASSPQRVERLIVVEELEPFLEDSIRALGHRGRGQELLPDRRRVERRGGRGGREEGGAWPSP